MADSENETKEEYPMDKRIMSILKRAPKRGIWLKELAFKLKISRPLLNYYIYGMKKNECIKGGRISKLISIKVEGNNRFISLRKE
jgi:predicted transcriptional regulator